MKLTFRTVAAADMRRIATETRARWGHEQAMTYADRLRGDIKSLTRHPLRFPEYAERPGLRRMNSGKHAIFYRVGVDAIDIVRVLHAASNFEDWLG